MKLYAGKNGWETSLKSGQGKMPEILDPIKMDLKDIHYVCVLAQGPNHTTKHLGHYSLEQMVVITHLEKLILSRISPVKGFRDQVEIDLDGKTFFYKDDDRLIVLIN